MPGSKNKICVLQIVKGLDIGGINGGAERFALDLARAIDHQKFSVSVCIFFRMQTSTAQEWERRLANEKLDIFFATDWLGNDRFSAYLKGIKKLEEYISQQPVDIAQSHFQLGTVAALYLKSKGLVKKTIRTGHISPEREWSAGWYGWTRKQIFTKWLFPLLLDAEVGVSQAIVQEMSQQPAARLLHRQPLLIHNAISMPEKLATPASPKNVNFPVLGVVGRLAEQKGHRFLLDAVALVRAQFPNLELWIIGDGELRKELEAQANHLGLENCVRFMGRQENVLDLLPHLDLFILPSLWEGLPTVILECFAYGVPVLATDIPGTRELVKQGETGWLVPPANSRLMAERIVTILSEPLERERVRKQGISEADKYSIQSIGAQYEDLFQSISIYPKNVFL